METIYFLTDMCYFQPWNFTNKVYVQISPNSKVFTDNLARSIKLLLESPTIHTSLICFPGDGDR